MHLKDQKTGIRLRKPWNRLKENIFEWKMFAALDVA